jgi:hypothetical protein
MDGLPVEGMPKHKGTAFAEIGKPIPGKDAFDADDQIRPVRRDGLEKWLWSRRHVPVHQDLPIPV